jgi:hypothetical protein
MPTTPNREWMTRGEGSRRTPIFDRIDPADPACAAVAASMRRIDGMANTHAKPRQLAFAPSGASLDAFPTKPLPRASPLWNHPNVIITPHNAGASDPRAVAKNVLTQIERFERGLPLEHVVDRKTGY